MSSKPVAILRFKWRDFANVQPTWPDNAYTGCFLPIRPSGASRYWQDCTFGLLDLTGSIVYPWRVLDLDKPNSLLDRRILLPHAIEKGLDEGFPLHDFGYVVAMVIPNLPGVDAQGKAYWPIDGGGVPVVRTRGGTWSCALLSETDGHQFFVHEFGHLLNFDHSWGRSEGTPAEYADPYCVMSAEDYGTPSKPVWVSGADPAMPVHSDYWKGMAPSPAGATLYHYLPEFTTAGYAVELGSNFANVPRSIRLNALDMRRKSCVGVVQIPGSNLRYTVEYRRKSGWDRAVYPAVVIHSIGPTGNPNQPIGPIFEGLIPVPPKGDLDWRSSDKKIAVLLDSVEDDGSAVEVTIGGVSLIESHSVAIDVVEGGSSELVEEGEAEVFVPPICGKQRFRFFIDHQDTVIRCEASAQGFDNPNFAWQVNDVSVSFPDISVLAPAVRTPVVAHFPRPDSETTEARTARLEFSFEGNWLELRARRQDGNYDLNIEVTVTEQNAAAGSSSATNNATAKVTGVIVRYEQAYYEAVKACSDMLEGVARKYAKSRIKLVRKDAPLTRNIAVLENLQRIVAQNNPVLAEQVGQAVRVLRNQHVLERRNFEGPIT